MRSESFTLSFVDIGILIPIVSGMTPQEKVDLSGTAICLLDARRTKTVWKMNESNEI